MTVHNPRKFGRTSKLQVVCEQIYDLALQLEPGGKLPTVIQLSSELDVSKASIDLALQQLEQQKVIVRKHGVGIFVAKEIHQKIISVIFSPTFFQEPNYSPFWDLLLEELRLRTAEQNEYFELHLAQPSGMMSTPLQRGIAHEMASGQVHGVIGVGLDKAATDWIEAQGVPFVSVFAPGRYTVELDNPQMIRLGVQELSARNCQKIGYWQPVMPDSTLESLNSSWAGVSRFNSFLEEYGLPTASQFNMPFSELELKKFGRMSHQEQGFEAAKRVFTAPKDQWPQGLIISDDKMTHGALMALQQLNIKPGRDIHIVSHANKGSSVLLGHNITCMLVEYDPGDVVRVAFSLLGQWSSGEATPEIHRVQPRLRLVEESVSL